VHPQSELYENSIIVKRMLNNFTNTCLKKVIFVDEVDRVFSRAWPANPFLNHSMNITRMAYLSVLEPQ
jgi:hypothetical protein